MFAKQLNDETAPLKEIESELKTIAFQILNHDSVDYKFELNRKFTSRMMTILKRADSYDYNFDSLTTISRIYPEDQSFRIFTWQITDLKYKAHRYFGIVQRKFKGKDGKDVVLLYRLEDDMDFTNTTESTVLDQNHWMGALYYVPKNKKFGVTTYTGISYTANPITGKVKKVPAKYYIILGWNGHDVSTNYKIVDAISFDPKDSTKVNFGAPIFYFSNTPKARVVAAYADNSPLSLNFAQILTPGSFKPKKTEAIVFDHVTKPEKVNNTKFWQYGSDGTFDAIVFYNKFYEMRKGFFGFKKNVMVYSPDIDKYDPKEIEKRAKEEEKRLKEAGIDLSKKKKTNE